MNALAVLAELLRKKDAQAAALADTGEVLPRGEPNKWSEVQSAQTAPPTQAAVGEAVQAAPPAPKMGVMPLPTKVNLASRNVLYSQPEIQQHLESYRSIPYIQESEKALKDFEDARLAMLQKPTQVDYSPLLAWADQMSGGKSLAAYQKPVDNQDKLMAYQAEVQKRKEEQAKDFMASFQKMKEGSNTEKLLQVMRGVGQGGKNVEQDISKTLAKMSGDYVADTGKLAAIDAGLKTNKIEDLNRTLALVARILSDEKGVLTEKDVGRTLFKTLGQTTEEWAAWAAGNKDADFSPYLDDLKHAVKEAKKRVGSKYQNLLTNQEAVWATLPSYVNSNALQATEAFRGKFKPLESEEAPVDKVAQFKAMAKEILDRNNAVKK